MMVPVQVVVVFAIGAAFLMAAIGYAFYRKLQGSTEPTNRLSNVLATVGGVIAGGAMLLGLAHQGIFT
ncbi:hypothetical protein [Curtobacterium sp. PhB115]|uniref:hypothetical protein n=1 Tax=Curtobacterium sp. PhB115 TaxID=2485173 RepID=UPI000F4BCC69|nr:hypothetical protein [Curtobacterium sp. PhB115]ROP72734.1 hypothetical protein EDF19_1753 [Curtobacterium sp. PhB115]